MPLLALALLAWRHRLRFPRVSRADWLQLAKLGLIGHTLHIGMVTWGIHWSTAFSSSVILACGPVFTLLILRGKGVERMTAPQVGGVLLACAGVLVFLSDKLAAGRWQAGGGDLVLVVAASLFSYYTVAAKPMIERLGAVTVMCYSTILASVPTVLIALPGAAGADWSALTPTAWAMLAWAIVVSAFCGWLLWGWVNAVRGVARTAPLAYLTPPVAGLVAWFLAGERFGMVKIVGAAVVLAGVALAQIGSRGAREVPARIE
jgi:drug/metabolite transporter (DMT)-like permease